MANQNHRLHAVLGLLAAFTFLLQPTSAQENRRGPILALGFSGNSNDPGWVYKLDATGGYRFGDHFEIDGGLPIYFVRVSADNVDGYSSKSGIGNAYIDLRGILSGDRYYFSSNLRGSAPTGDEENGFSTGRVAVDWTNYFDVRFGRWTPFGSAGMANTVSDTHFFSRPFTSLGFVGHFEGGLIFAPLPWASIGASGYAVQPSGEQKVFSKVVARGAGAARGNGRNRAFETQSVTIGESALTTDRGYSGWINVSAVPGITLELGGSRSESYNSNSLFFSARFEFGRLIR